MNNLGRAHENFSNAIHSLVIGRGNINERLVDAFHHLIGINDESDVPEGLRDEFHQLMERMTSETSALEGEGTIQATARAMSTEDAVEVAEQVWALAYQIRTQWDDEVGRIGKRTHR
jgi:hypothetical protein